MSTLNLTKRGTGLILEYGHVRLALDTGMRGEVTLLSHAHADHLGTISQASSIIATKGTFDTYFARGGRLHCQRTTVKYGDIISQLGVTIKALNAGHVLGSTMFYMDFDDRLRVLYTGDFNMVDSMVHKAAKTIEADVLITEATYGTPEWIFPKRKEIYEQLLSVVESTLDNHRIPLFKAYSLGKAQEAIALLQREGIEVISGNKTIDSVSKAYNRHGAGLEFESLHSRRAADMLKDGAPIVCSSLGHTMRYLRKIFSRGAARQIENSIEKYTLSGWTLGRYAERGFPLSGHSDFPHLLKFARAAKPRIAYSFTDNAQEFSQHLSQLGINAVPLE